MPRRADGAAGAGHAAALERDKAATQEAGPSLDELFATPIIWRRWWAQIPELILVVCALGLPSLIATNVLARYTNWFQVPWAQDIVRVLFLWIVFLGGAVAVKYEAHVRMGMLADRFAGRGALGHWWMVAIRVSPVAMGVILLVLGVRVVELDMKNRLTWLEIPLGYFATIVPASGALMSIYTAQILKKAAAQRRLVHATSLSEQGRRAGVAVEPRANDSEAVES
jgi:TRAP-type C4-dicarboxylate transport system permease small subunit